MIETLFLKLQISPKETRVFLTLADLGKSSASLLAKKVDLPRSTVYSALDGLIKRGLVSREQTSDTTLFIANHPDSLREMIKEERLQIVHHLTEKEVLIEELIPSLTPLFNNAASMTPKLQFFEGAKSVRAMLNEHCRTWQQSIAAYDHTWWGYQDHYFVEGYREWLDYYWNSMLPKEKICLLSNKSSTEKKLKHSIARRTIKAIPKKYQFSSTVWVLGDYVITIMTRETPHYAFQLKDPVFAANQRLMFQMMWEKLL